MDCVLPADPEAPSRACHQGSRALTSHQPARDYVTRFLCPISSDETIYGFAVGLYPMLDYPTLPPRPDDD